MEMINGDELADVLEHQCLVFSISADNRITHVHLDLLQAVKWKLRGPATEPATQMQRCNPVRLRSTSKMSGAEEVRPAKSWAKPAGRWT